MSGSKELLTRYRTKIIEDFIMIEGYVSAIICKHYLGHVDGPFMREVLFDESCSTSHKANMLEKSLPHYLSAKLARQHADSFRRLARIRNYFAHCNTTFAESTSESTPDGVPHPHPRHNGQRLDVEEEIRTFTEVAARLSEDLVGLMDRMGILFVQDTDKGVLSIALENVSATRRTAAGNAAGE